MHELVTVAIPTLNGGTEFEQTLGAVRAQRLDREVELLICDSGSVDDTREVARDHGARVLEIPAESFSHGGTRNLLMSHARGDHVAFLTQDALPAAPDWLARLLEAFGLADRVGLAFGPYRPRPDASLSVARELTTWFASFSDGAPRIDALAPAQREIAARHLLGHLGYFTDANGCVARAAWEQVPFRDVPYAEDHVLAHDMLRAGFAKVYVPEAAVIHSHEYSLGDWLRRSFDEARAVRVIYDWDESASLRVMVRNLRGNVGADWRWGRRDRSDTRGPRPAEDLSLLTASTLHHGARTIGAILGAHSGRLSPLIARHLSLEGRGR
jgi:glycosyltransferase involved in cell wall biosynthesis